MVGVITVLKSVESIGLQKPRAKDCNGLDGRDGEEMTHGREQTAYKTWQTVEKATSWRSYTAGRNVCWDDIGFDTQKELSNKTVFS